MPAAATLTDGGLPRGYWLTCTYWPPPTSKTPPTASPPLICILTSLALPAPSGSPGRTKGITETITRSKPSRMGLSQGRGQNRHGSGGIGQRISTSSATDFHQGNTNVNWHDCLGGQTLGQGPPVQSPIGIRLLNAPWSIDPVTRSGVGTPMISTFQVSVVLAGTSV